MIGVIKAGVGATGLVSVLFAAVATTASAAPPAVQEALRTAAAPVAELRRADAIDLPGGSTVYRYQQEVGGLPVDGALAIVADPNGASPELVADESEGGLDPAGAPSLSAARAVEIASGSIDLRRARGAPAARLELAPRGDGALVWDVKLPSARPFGDFEVLVDAGDGEVLATHDLLRHAEGEAKLFVTNAVTENQGYRRIVKIGRREGHPRRDRDRDTQLLQQLRSPVVLEHLRDGQRCLVGRWVKAKVGRKARKVCRASRDWSRVKRGNNKFEALMGYHAIDRTQTYIRDLGFTGGDGVNAERQDTITRPFDLPPRDGLPDDNSFYSPFSDRITLGVGGVDDGEDQDVIIHEYGHAVQDAQVKGFGRRPQAGAMGEGFGDYLAAAMSAETPEVTAHATFDPCIMEWDATSYDTRHNGSICLRRTDNGRTLEEQRDRCGSIGAGRNEIHCVGEVWSSALWALREALGDQGDTNVMDRVVLSSHFLLTADASFSEAARALIDADEVLPGNHCDEIADEMVEREFLANQPDCS